jgi:predicted metal-dependent hydrolase
MKRTVIAGNRRIEYILFQTPRKNVLFQALPEGVTRVYAPKYMRLRDIDEMVRQRADQLEEMHRNMDHHLEEDRRKHPVTDGSTLMVEGVPHVLRLFAGKPVRGIAKGGEYRLTLPEPESDPAVRAAIRSTLSARALERIRSRVNHYAPQIGVQPGRITIRDQKSRWGSCSSKGNLNFNWKLIMAPECVLDYVVIHELCHLIEFNHSPRFWQCVYAQMPDYEAWKKWLKLHTDDLYM